jgi:hypothetical protein
MKVGDSYLVSKRRIDQIQQIIPGSDLVMINVYLKTGDYPFTFENREQSRQSIYTLLKPITEFQAKAFGYIPENEPSTDLYDDYISKTTPTGFAMPEFQALMKTGFKKPSNNNSSILIGTIFGAGLLLLLFI